MSHTGWTPVADTSAWKPVEGAPVSGGKTEGRNLPVYSEDDYDDKGVSYFPGEKRKIDPATGRVLRHGMPGQEGANLAENLGGWVEKGPIEVGAGAVDIGKGNIKHGLNRMFSGAGTTMMPAAPFFAAGAPVTFARALAGGYLGSKVGEGAVKIAGGDEESQQLGGNIGNVLGGFTAASGLPRAFLETPIKNLAKNPALMKAVLKVLEPKKALVEALKSGIKDAIAEPSGVTESTAAGPVPADTGPAPAPYRLSGNQITDATTVTPRRILGPERQLPAAPETARPSSVPETKLPNATYLRPDARSLSQQPPAAAKPDLLSGIREHEFLMKVQDELNRQGGDEQAQAEIDKWMEAHNQKAPGAKKPSLFEQSKAKFEAAKAEAEGKANVVPADEAPTVAYRMRNAGEKGIMPNPGKTAQASLDPKKVQSYGPGRAQAENHPQEMVKIDLTKLNPNEYTVQPNGYVKFKGAVPESFIEKMPETPEVPDPNDPTAIERLLMKTLQSIKAQKAKAAQQGAD